MSHSYLSDERNADILININGELFARDDAKISVFDAGFIRAANVLPANDSNLSILHVGQCPRHPPPQPLRLLNNNDDANNTSTASLTRI